MPSGKRCPKTILTGTSGLRTHRTMGKFRLTHSAQWKMSSTSLIPLWISILLRISSIPIALLLLGSLAIVFLPCHLSMMKRYGISMSMALRNPLTQLRRQEKLFVGFMDCGSSHHHLWVS